MQINDEKWNKVLKNEINKEYFREIEEKIQKDIDS